jgi:hypothetical protein
MSIKGQKGSASSISLCSIPLITALYKSVASEQVAYLNGVFGLHKNGLWHAIDDVQFCHCTGKHHEADNGWLKKQQQFPMGFFPNCKVVDSVSAHRFHTETLEGPYACDSYLDPAAETQGTR